MLRSARGREKGNSGVDLDPTKIETDLVDLSAISLRELRELRDADRRLLERSKAAMLSQLEHARTNLGSGPPGRVD
jgi:hypothetical protein